MINYSIILLLLAFLGCKSNWQQGNILAEQKTVCPKGHTDHIIPILYGFPTEQSFRDADSGKVMLGGCEPGEEQHYCTIHEISF